MGARISSPFARVTPTVRPSRMSMEATSASVRIVAPADSAERAIAWLIARPSVTAPIASASNLDQLHDILKATELKLGKPDIDQLNAASG